MNLTSFNPTYYKDNKWPMNLTQNRELALSGLFNVYIGSLYAYNSVFI